MVTVNIDLENKPLLLLIFIYITFFKGIPRSPCLYAHTFIYLLIKYRKYYRPTKCNFTASSASEFRSCSLQHNTFY